MGLELDLNELVAELAARGTCLWELSIRGTCRWELAIRGLSRWELTTRETRLVF